MSMKLGKTARRNEYHSEQFTLKKTTFLEKSMKPQFKFLSEYIKFKICFKIKHSSVIKRI